MMKAIEDLLCKVEELKMIKQKYDSCFTLQIVPSIYVGGINLNLSPTSDVIKFCYETDTKIDIDLYVYDSNY